MNEHDIQTTAPATDGGKTGYKRPPVKTRFRAGKSGNPFGRRKGQRNLSTVLSEILRQTVTIKQGEKSDRVSKGEALIKVVLNKANNGDRRAIDAVTALAEKIGRVDDTNSETSPRGAVMLVPGVAKSLEEYKTELAKHRARKALQERQSKINARALERNERFLRHTIVAYKGEPAANIAATRLDELLHSDEYVTNFNITQQSNPSEQQTKQFTQRLKILWAARTTVREAKNQGPEEQRAAAQAFEDAKADFENPYEPTIAERRRSN
jgi:Family of unknown function (DUF5681)